MHRGKEVLQRLIALISCLIDMVSQWLSHMTPMHKIKDGTHARAHTHTNAHACRWQDSRHP